jgi:hypothetical protein
VQGGAFASALDARLQMRDRWRRRGVSVLEFTQRGFEHMEARARQHGLDERGRCLPTLAHEVAGQLAELVLLGELVVLCRLNDADVGARYSRSSAIASSIVRRSRLSGSVSARR